MPLPHLKRTLECSTRGTRLSVRYNQLVIRRPDVPDATVPIEDIGMIVIDDMQATMTQSALVRLVESNASIVISGTNHMPVGMMLPFQAHMSLVSVQRAQINMSTPRQKQLWKAIVQSKIRQQARVLHHFYETDYGLSSLSRQVRSGDTTNMEAQAAQRYWPRLFGSDFRRRQTLPGINALLNYGYAVVRAAVARAVVSTGMLPSIGLHHHNRSNGFCLADDLVEPFRPFVDHTVKIIEQASVPGETLSMEDRAIRSKILSVLSLPTRIGSQSTPLSLAIGMSATSLARCIEDREAKLVLPSSQLPSRSAKPTPVRANVIGSVQRKTA